MSTFRHIILFIMPYYYTVVEPRCYSDNSDMSSCISESLLYFNGNTNMAANLLVRMAKDLAVNGNRKLNKTLKVPDDMFVTCEGECGTVEICSSTQSAAGESTPAYSSKSELSASEQYSSQIPSSPQLPSSSKTSFPTRQPCKKLPLSVGTARFRRSTMAVKSKSQCNSLKTTRHRTTATAKKTTKSCTTKPTCKRTKQKRTTKLKSTTKLKCTTKLKGTTKQKCSRTTANSHCSSATCKNFGTTVNAKSLQNAHVPPKIKEGTAAAITIL